MSYEPAVKTFGSSILQRGPVSSPSAVQIKGTRMFVRLGSELAIRINIALLGVVVAAAIFWVGVAYLIIK